MAQAAGICNHSGCYCKGYIIPTSKWSKGKCKSCNHSKKEHGDIEADVTYESKEAVAAPLSANNEYSKQIDGKMGIVPSGKTNYKDVGSYGGGQQKEPSIYSIHLDESDWINWSSNDLLVWFRQKKRFPESLNLDSIEHEMKNNNINGSKMTQLTHSTLLSYGFKEYDHRTRILAEVKKLLEKHPSASQTPKFNYGNNNNNNNNKNNKNKEKIEEKQQIKENKGEAELLKDKNLNESEWKKWNCDQVWEWIKIKQGWGNSDELEYLVVHKLNEYAEKLKSNEIQLNGAKFIEVQNDMKTQKLLKGIGFPFSVRKVVYKNIDTIIRHYPN